jgi:hypothetical protein
MPIFFRIRKIRVIRGQNANESPLQLRSRFQNKESRKAGKIAASHFTADEQGTKTARQDGTCRAVD